TVSGHITQNGVPVGAGNINFSPKKGTQSGGSSQIGGDGSYTVSGLSTGDFLVRVFSPSVRYDADYSVSGNATFDIDMKGATLRGRVVDASTNEPVSDANVWVDPTKEVKFGQGTTSGGDGRFTLNAVPDGTFTIHASREKYSPATQSVVVASGTAPDVEVRLDRGQETVIQIVDAPSGNPIGGFVGILSGNKVVNNGSPGDDGKTHVWLPPGTYKANVSAPDYVSTRIDLTVPGPEARVPLSRAGRLIIVSKNGGDVRVGLAGLPLDSPVGGIIKTFVRAQPGISTYVGALAPGHYQVDLMNSDRVTVKQSYSVDVIAGQTATLNID
ncbi:MAG TPA: carboxypeptidase-like regulatory domain-containing protein, partial [Thermoanaerobaculia bacterium]